MDEELKAILEKARNAGADKEQLQRVVNKYRTSRSSKVIPPTPKQVDVPKGVNSQTGGDSKPALANTASLSESNQLVQSPEQRPVEFELPDDKFYAQFKGSKTIRDGSGKVASYDPTTGSPVFDPESGSVSISNTPEANTERGILSSIVTDSGIPENITNILHSKVGKTKYLEFDKEFLDKESPTEKDLQDLKSRQTENFRLDTETKVADMSFYRPNDGSTDEDLDRVVGNIGEYGFNSADFNSYLDKSNPRLKSLIKEGIVGVDGDMENSERKVATDIQIFKNLGNYLIDRNKYLNDLESVLEYRKSKGEDVEEEIKNITTERQSLREGLAKYTQDNLKGYTDLIDKKKDQTLEEYKKYKSGNNSTTMNTLGNLSVGLFGSIADMSITVGDLLGADTFAEQARVKKEIRNITESYPLESNIYSTGREVKHKGTRYGVTSSGSIIDLDSNLDVTSIVDKLGINRDTIIQKAEESDKKFENFSTRNMIVNGGNVLGNLAVQLVGTKGIGALVGTSTKAMVASNMAMTGGMVYTSTYEGILQELRDNNISEDKSREYANDIAMSTGAVAAITSILSPNAKAQSLLSGNGMKSVVKAALAAEKEGGKKAMLKSIRDGVIKSVASGLKEGTEEAIQENLEYLTEKMVSNDVNDRLGEELLNEDITMTDIVNNTVLAFGASGVLAGAGSLKESGFSKDKFEIYNLLGKDFGKTEGTINEMINKGLVTEKRGKDLLNNVEKFHKYVDKMPEKMAPEKTFDMIDLLDKRNKLESRKNTEDKAFHKSINESIMSVDEEIQALMSSKVEKAPVTQVYEETQQTQPEADTAKDNVKNQKAEVRTEGNNVSEDVQQEANIQDESEEIKTVLAASKMFFSQSEKDIALQDLEQTLKELEGRGRLSPAQSRTLINRALAVDPTKEKQVSRFTDYFKKQVTKADIRDLKSSVRAKKRKIKKAAKVKSKSTPQAVKDLARNMGTPNYKYLSKKDLGTYERLLDQLSDGMKAVTNKSYKMPNLDRINTSLEELVQKAEKARAAKLAKQMKLDATDLTPKEIEAIWESKNADETIDNMKEERAREARTLLEKQGAMSNTAINSYQSDTPLSDNEKRTIKSLRSVDLEGLSSQMIKRYIKVTDNIIVNNDFTSSYDLESIITKTKDAKEMTKLLKGNKIFRLNDSTIINDFKTLALMYKSMMGDPKLAAKFDLLSGLGGISKSEVKTKNTEKKLGDDYSKILKRGMKTDKTLMDSESVVFRGIVQNLIQGSTEEDFEINRSRLDQHIERLNKLESPENKRKAKAHTEVYSRLKGLESQEEVINFVKSNYKENYDLIKYWLDFFESTKSDLKNNTEIVHGERMGEFVDNYLPIKLKNTGSFKSLTEGAPFMMGGISEPKKSTTTIQRTKTKKLPKDRTLDLNFDSVMFDRAYRVLNDINSSKNFKDVKNFFEALKAEEVLPEETLSVLQNKIVNIRETNSRIPRSNNSDQVVKLVSKVEGFLRKMATRIALGSVTQYPKQYISVAIHVMSRLGKDSDLMMKNMFTPKGDMPLLDMYSISQRGDTQGGTLRRGERADNTKKIKLVSNNISSKVGLAKEALDNAIFMSLRAGDVNAAKSSWVSFYQKYLRDSGYDLNKDVDMSTEHEKIGDDKIRQEAASYAEVMVEETQLTSSEGRASNFFSKDESSYKSIIKSIFLPYQSFNINSKVRMLVDMENLRKGIGVKDKKIVSNAASSLGGTLVEQLTFQTLKYFILSEILKYGKEGIETLFSLDLEDEDEERNLAFRKKQFKSALVKDLNPFAIGTLAENLVIEGLNYASYLEDEGRVNDDEDLYTWTRRMNKEEGGLPYYRYGDKAGLNLEVGMGVYSTPFEKMTELWDSYDMAFDENPSIRNKYGKLKELDFDEDERKLMKVGFILDILNLTTGVEADTYRQLKKVQRQVTKEN